MRGAGDVCENRGDADGETRGGETGGDDDARAASDGVPTGDGDAQVIVVTSGKGGVGKTTSSANLGMSMARLPGYRVALIDADIGLRNLDLLLGLENRRHVQAADGSVGG